MFSRTNVSLRLSHNITAMFAQIPDSRPFLVRVVQQMCNERFGASDVADAMTDLGYPALCGRFVVAGLGIDVDYIMACGAQMFWPPAHVGPAPFKELGIFLSALEGGFFKNFISN